MNASDTTIALRPNPATEEEIAEMLERGYQTFERYRAITDRGYECQCQCQGANVRRGEA